MPTIDQFDPYLAWLDIKPHEHPVDHYRLLGIDKFESDTDCIKRAADERMRHVRSFQTGPRGRHTQKLLNDLAAAKLCLLNDATRSSYDSVLRGAEAASSDGEPTAPPVQEQESGDDSPAPSAISRRPLDAPEEREPTPPPIAEAAGGPLATGGVPDPPASMVRAPGPDRTRLMVVVSMVLMAGAVSGILLAILWPAESDAPRTSEPGAESDEIRAAARKPKPPKFRPEVVVQQEASGAFHFPASLARLHGELRFDASSDWISNWSSSDQWLSWTFKTVRPGAFRAELVYVAEAASAGGNYTLEIGHRSKSAEVRASEPPGANVFDELIVVVSRRGRSELRIRANEVRGGELFRFRWLKLLPAGS